MADTNFEVGFANCFDMKTPSKLHLGAAYYPEHWPEARWKEDIQLMRAAGLTVVRMAEFAWSTLEPSRGKYNFDWLDRAIALLAEAGIASVLGTPTAAPPAWLVQQSPDLLAVDENGRRVQFGNRCHYCVNSPEFHTATHQIVSALAEHFGNNPGACSVIGWQLDNEYNRVCYCERCQRLFQQYLAGKYGSLETLNDHWTTRYWSQTYSAWEQIPIPISGHNPGLMLEFKRFITESYRKFQKIQLDALRPHLLPGIWVTHNFMGWFDGFDHYTLTQDLDIASWDWYIGTGHHDYLNSGGIHDLTRGFKRRNFWLIETQPGHVNWSPLNNDLNQGEARVMAWHAVAHGADAVLYWQWRSPLGGQEQYHGTLVDQSGQPRPFFDEVQRLGQEFAAMSPLIAGSCVKSRVALLNDYESRWAIQWQRHHQDFDYVAHFNTYYRPLAALNVSVDVLSSRQLTGIEQLDSYRLIIAPALHLVDNDVFTTLREYVARGGHLVLTLRSGMKDIYNSLLPSRQPGPFAEMAGVEVEDYFAIQDAIPVKGRWFEGQSTIWAERLKLREEGKSVEVIARYGKSNGWLDNQAAITVCPYGKGMVYYVGAYLDEAAQRKLLIKVLKTARISMIGTHPGVEVRTRLNPEGIEIYFVINHEPVEQTVWLPWPAQEHLTGSHTKSELKLGPYAVAILTQLMSRDE